MPKPTTITRDEWLDALAESDRRTFDPSALSVTEIAVKWQLDPRTTRRKVEAMVRAGKLVRVFKYIVNVAGQRQIVPAYLIKK